MKLNREDAELFYKLYWALLYHVNKEYKIINNLDKPSLKGQNIKDVQLLDEKLFYRIDFFIDSFVKNNEFFFNNKELEIIKSWKRYIKGKFNIFHDKENLFKVLFYTIPMEIVRPRFRNLAAFKIHPASI